MRWMVIAAGVALVAGASVSQAREQAIEDPPKGVWDLATVWNGPIQQVNRDARRFDLVSGLWLGLLEGSVKSAERTASLVLPDKE
ncbi:MAG: hypothetical protein HY599_00900 [Candidatus Omnitrophica bacterium]|nr:hypothetical protein [Candidatus Omnitrophota bacterium]